MDQSRFHPPNLLDSTATALLRRAAQGEAASWRLLVELYGPIVRYWLRRAGLNDSADRGDVFQETFFAAARNLPAFERQAGQAKFRAWLKTITQSKVAQFYRDRGKQAVAVGGSTVLGKLHDIPDAPVAEPAGTDEEDASLAHSEGTFLAQRMLARIRSEFEESTWQAFYRTTVEGCTSQQAATELGMTALAVRKAKSRIMQRLRAAMAELPTNAVTPSAPSGEPRP
jgi:RNA polymerase sigma-70 factor (ECF subfamily)